MKKKLVYKDVRAEFDELGFDFFHTPHGNFLAVSRCGDGVFFAGNSITSMHKLCMNLKYNAKTPLMCENS